ncbi:DMT family transporter [Propionivibrio limicola]|uniref:DMT family transporter n=1 Tax=Propionivibrio limicola TaxID=167645 RepID=UPI0012927D4F|nr:DMT family transporter [Propionivibrio limicola]
MGNTQQKTVAPGNRTQKTAVLALLTGALVWGLIWYPYRILRDLGVDGVSGTMATYAVAFLLGLVFFRRALTGITPSWSLFWLALAAGGCNIGYVMGTLHGEVVRVLLLFYLAPLWTVLLSRILLGERLNRFGAFVVALSLAGAATILWHPEAGLPIPTHAADWFGLGAGFSFALFNVLSRYAHNVTIEVKSMVAFAGVVIVGGALLLAGYSPSDGLASSAAWLQIGLIGSILVVVNLVVQFGLTHVASNRAIVIMLTEVGIAAMAAWLLAGEAFGLREALGGAMIVAASVFSARMEATE